MLQPSVRILRTTSLSAERMPTLFFLREAQRTPHIYLSTEVNCERFLAGRARRSEMFGEKLGQVALFAHLIAPVLDRYPEARQVFRHGWRPQIAEYEGVPLKILVNRKLGDKEALMALVVPSAERRSSRDIQRLLNDSRSVPEEPAHVQRLKRFLAWAPAPLAGFISRRILQNFARRGQLQGSVAISSLGHADVSLFLPKIFGSLGFGLGKISDRVVVDDHTIAIKPMMTLGLVFDHHVLDGSLAAKILSDVKYRLENCPMEEYCT